MKLGDDRYCQKYPWKAIQCFACLGYFRLRKNERYCNDCKDKLKHLPPSLSNKVRNGEIKIQKAMNIYKNVLNSREVASGLKDKSVEKKCHGKLEEDEIMGIATNLGTFTTAHLAKEMGITIQTARRYLDGLREKGLVEKDKCVRLTFWHVLNIE